MNAPLAEFTDFEGLRKALNVCREKRDLSFARLDEISGLPDGYSAKLLGPRALRKIGLQSLGDILGAVGVKCVLVTDPEALARVQSRFTARDEAHLQSVHRGGTTIVKLSRRHMSIIQAKGRRSRWEKMTPKQRAKWATKMVKLREKKRRKAAHLRRKCQVAYLRRTRKPMEPLTASSGVRCG